MSVRPSIFLDAKNTQNLGETGPPVPVSVFISMAIDQLLSPAERAWGASQPNIVMKHVLPGVTSGVYSDRPCSELAAG